MTRMPPRIELRRRSQGVHLDDRRGERLRRLLRQVVTDPPTHVAMNVFAGELRGIGSRRRMRRAVGVPFERDRRYGDDRSNSKPTLEGVIGRLPLSEAEAPAIVVNDNADVIRIVE